jgi:glutamine synthetase
VRFEGNNYSAEWVKEAKKRGLLNLRNTPEGLAQMETKIAQQLLVGLNILSKEELASRYHVRLERYVKDILIEMHTLAEMVNTQVLPAAYRFLHDLQTAAAAAKSAGIKVIPQVAAAERVGGVVATLQRERDALEATIAKAETLHDALEQQAMLLTTAGRDVMGKVRAASDTLELGIADEYWPLPRYREMLFPV